jgi:hypothetical protein
MHIRPNTRDFPDNLKWRGAALSEFDGKRWSNPFASGQHIPLGPEGWALVTNRPHTGRRLFYQVTLNAVDSDALFVAGRPEHMSVAVIRGPNDSVRLGFAPPDNFHYSVTSIVEDPSRAIDHTGLSPWERVRYLQLPLLDPRIRTLAGEVIAGSVTDLQRARAIENHLRTSYGYTLDLPERETRDPIAYFLFERKKGHCEYFASAMTVLLRAVGIPARIANGFQSGTFNPLSKLYVIRASDAHGSPSIPRPRIHADDRADRSPDWPCGPMPRRHFGRTGCCVTISAASWSSPNACKHPAASWAFSG